MRIGILATHPIQYHAPLFRSLAGAEDLDVSVYFCHRPTTTEQGVGFGVPFQWDVDLTEGYPHTWLRNFSQEPSVTTFRGCHTPEIADVIEKQQFDAFIVHGWNHLSCWQAFRACWRTGTPLFVRSDSQLAAQSSLSRRTLKRFVYPFFITRFDVCLPYGQRSAEYFKHYRAKRIIVSPHFVDSDWFANSAAQEREQRIQLRAKWNVEEKNFIFLFAGKFEGKKRPLDPIQALERLVRAGIKDVALVMTGDGQLRPMCENLAREKNLPVHFTGFLNQTEMPKAYAISDCLILPSDGRETWGLVVNEAMACGLPAIVSDQVGCRPDLIIDGKTGYAYRCGDLTELTGCMMKLAEDRELSKRLGIGAKNHIADYGVEKAADIIVRTVHELVDKRRKDL